MSAMSQYIEDYMRQCSEAELETVIARSALDEQDAMSAGSQEMVSYHSWTRFYAEREIEARRRA